ncbi:hypothetical protein Droror1_Dr00022102 [Drosera rotundifolia]
MAEANQERELDVIVQGTQGEISKSDSSQVTKTKGLDIRRWIRVAVYTLFLLIGQSVAILLGRVYYAKGGNSVWVETVAQVIGFPLLIPLYYIIPSQKAADQGTTITDVSHPSAVKLGFVYLSLGMLVAANTILYSMGLLYLPVSTYSLICASQLAFNALFSSLLNAQKFTPYIINSIFILTMSSVILVFHNDQDSGSIHESKAKYILGFLCTLGASAGNGLMLALSQTVFRKVLKANSFKVVLDLVFYTLLVASVVTSIGLLASGEWKGVREEMKGYELGSALYVMNLIGTAVLWQAFQLGCIGLVFEVCSLFSNVICTLGVPITPVLAVIFLHDKMNGLKVVSMLLALWGFTSYAYQHYVDDFKKKDKEQDLASKASKEMTRICK